MSAIPPPPPSVPPAQTPDQRTWAVMTHLSGLLLAVFSGGVLGFLGPLIVWLIKKDEDAYLRAHAAEALNFQISLVIYAIASAVLILVLVGILLVLVVIGIAIAFPIVAAVRASNGQVWRYPLTIRFVS
ncbi:MAG: DUF4870 domain-containing protein [Nitriliruptorales bacterium]|nr:DUF4870 domain-containing protein [Nitriliruptorales bacterium]